jgi:hypothetical protein
LARVGEHSSQQAQLTIYRELETSLEDETATEAWEILLNPIIAGIQFDVIAAYRNDLFAIEIKWSDTKRTVHLGTLASLSRSTTVLEDQRLLSAMLPQKTFRLGEIWPDRVTGVLVTNLTLVGTAARAAEEAGIQVISKETDQPKELASELVARLRRLTQTG